MDLSNSLGEIAAINAKPASKRGRKSKKQNEKEILYEYEQQENPSGLAGFKETRKVYEQHQYLSQKERDIFDQKFTKPKTKSQEI